MIKCVRGFVLYRKGGTVQGAIKTFRMAREKEGVKVRNVASCMNVGDGVFAIVANIEEKED